LKDGVAAQQVQSELDGILKAYSADQQLPVYLGTVVESFSQEVTETSVRRFGCCSAQFSACCS
jgi:hypothetical protein